MHNNLCSLVLGNSLSQDVPQTGQPGEVQLTGLHLLPQPGVFSLQVRHSQGNLVLSQPPSLPGPPGRQVVLLSPLVVCRVLDSRDK